jgi:drug/metabolite transporter (DMT)-like permease
LSVAVLVGGVLLVSPDGTVLAAMQAGLPTILLLRGALIGTGYLGVLRIRAGRVRSRSAWALGRGDVTFAILLSACNVLFVTSLRNTTIAHTLLIAASVPAITAAMTMASGAEPLDRKTVLAAGGVLFGVAVLVLTDPGRTALVGDLEALGSSVALAGALLTAPRGNRLPAAQAIAAAITFVVVIPWARPGTLGVHDLVLAVFGFGILLPCASSLVMGARRTLSAVEVSLVMMLESVFGPLWGWVWLGQRPSWQTVSAGAVILTSVGVHTIAPSERRRP